jgi:mitogen-activated protein kinase kinase kinase
LLDSYGNIKYSDFGAAKVFAKQGKTKAGVTMARTNLNSMTGTPMYMSPEGLMEIVLWLTSVITGADKGRHGALDIWSLGCCVLEMATGRRPWANLDNEWAVNALIPLMLTLDHVSYRCITSPYAAYTRANI